MGASELLQFHTKFAEWLFSTGMAFYEVEHPKLLEPLQILRKDVTVPSRKNLSTKILDECYDKSISTMHQLTNSTSCSLSTDAWTNVNGASVINYVCITKTKSFLLECKERVSPYSRLSMFRYYSSHKKLPLVEYSWRSHG